MFGKFNNEYINFNAVSEIVKIRQGDDYKIMLFRFDGSFMTSESYDDDLDATKAYENLWDWLMNAGIASTNR